MTEQEFLADLQTKVLWMGTPTPLDGGSVVDGVISKKVPIVELGLRGTATSPRQYSYTVVNVGVSGEENPMLNESAYPTSAIDLPVGDALTAIEYLESRKAAGDWSAYDYDSGRSDLGYFFAKVWVATETGKETEKRIRVSYDAQGNPSHSEII